MTVFLPRHKEEPMLAPLNDAISSDVINVKNFLEILRYFF